MFNFDSDFDGVGLGDIMSKQNSIQNRKPDPEECRSMVVILVGQIMLIDVH